MKKLIATAILVSGLAIPTAFADNGYPPTHTGNIGASTYQPPQQRQEVFTTRGDVKNWGLNVPVFRERGDFFNARDKNYERRGSVVCRLERGQKVKFVQYLNWGVGEVLATGYRARTRTGEPCKGWIDGSVIR